MDNSFISNLLAIEREVASQDVHSLKLILPRDAKTKGFDVKKFR